MARQNHPCVKDGPRNLTLKFGQNLVSNRWDIPDMDKCYQDKCCLNKCHHNSLNLLTRVPEAYLLSLVKIGSVTTEILQILSSRWWAVGGGGGDVQSHFRVKPKHRLG